MKEFDLNIEKVLENWTIPHALREIISNAIDEQILTGSKEIEIYFDDDNCLHIRDYGRGLKYIHLTQNENEEKLQHKNLIGKFGVGLKDALATFDRHNKKVVIISQYGCITMGKSHKHGFEDITTLHAYINEASDKSFIGTEFIIYDCSQDDVKQAKNMFLMFSSDKLLEKTDVGEIYEKVNGVASIYFNGVKVAEEDNFLFSYNVTSLNAAIKKALNRERSNVGRSAYSERIKAILLQAKSEVVINHLTKNLNQYNSGNISDELKWTDVATHAVRILNSRENVVFVTPKEMEYSSGNDVDVLKESGKTIIFVPETVKEKIADISDVLGNEVNTISTIINEYQDSFNYEFVEYAALTPKEKSVFDVTGDILKLYDAEYLLSKVRISNTVKPTFDGETANGAWDASLGIIVMLKRTLSSVESYAGTLIHEVIHAHKGLRDVERNFESELTRVLGILVGTVISNKLIGKVSFNKKSYGNSFEEKLQKISDKLSGKAKLSELFSNDFMRENTRLNSIQDFFDRASFNVQTQDEFDKLETRELDNNVRKFTSFVSWRNMLQEAIGSFVQRKYDDMKKDDYVEPPIDTNGTGCNYIYQNVNIKVVFG